MPDHSSPCKDVSVLDTTLATVVTRQDHMEKSLDSIREAQKLFEIETRASMSNLNEKVGNSTDRIMDKMEVLSLKIESSSSRVHGRIDSWVKAALVGTLLVLVGIIAYMWKTQVGG